MRLTVRRRPVYARGETLRILRQKLELSMAEAGERIGVRELEIAALESGAAEPWNWDELLDRLTRGE